MIYIIGGFSFGQQLVLNIVGPLTTAVVGGLIVGALVGIITRAYEKRKASRKLREGLIANVTQVSASLYIATQQFWRAKYVFKLTGDLFDKERNAVEARYAECRVEGTVLENCLEAYFEVDRPRLLCHQMVDLLTVRYFQLLFNDTHNKHHIPYKQNEGAGHTELSREQLENPKLLLNKYHAVQKDLCRALLHEPLDPRA